MRLANWLTISLISSVLIVPIARAWGAADRMYTLRQTETRSPIQFSLKISDKVPEKTRQNIQRFFVKFQSGIAAINSQLPTQVLSPLNLQILVRDGSGYSQTTWSDDKRATIELVAPAAYENLDSETFTRYFTAMALHEYGHALLDATFNFNSELYRKNMQISLHPSPATIEERNRAMVDLLFVKGYAEMFADFVAVLFTDNLDAISDVMKASGEKPADAEIRSFSLEYKLAGWSYVGPYGLLTPVRSTLGHMISENTTKLSKGEFVASLLAVMLASIDDERARLLQNLTPSMEYWELDVNPEQINRRLIDRCQVLNVFR